MADCRGFQRLEENGYQEELRSRHSHLRRYLPAFLTLPFQAEPGTQSLLRAIEMARRLDEGGERALPEDAPDEFIPPAWRNAYKQPDGRLDKRLWDIALALSVRDALRSGDLFLPASCHHVSFANLVYDEHRWRQERAGAYEQLSLFQEADEVLLHLGREFEEVARSADRGMANNRFASVRNGRLKLHGRDALDTTGQVAVLRRLIEASLPRVRIEDLLREVYSCCHFSQEFRPLGGYEARSENIYPTLLAALIAHGTNLGPPGRVASINIAGTI